MRIDYPKRSKFLKGCKDTIRQNKESLLGGTPISVNFSSQGYNGNIHVKIEKTNPTTFWVDWENSDPTRFPVRIKAAASALFRMGIYGDFIISHETGILTIRYLSSLSDAKNNSEQRVNLPDYQKKDNVEEIHIEQQIDKDIESKRDADKDPRVKFLLEFGRTISPQELFPVLNIDAASLIEENSFAFALAAVLDRGTKAEIIWTIPYYLQEEIGEINPRFFVGKTLEEIGEILQKLPLKPRYINDAPRTIKGLSEIVVNEFNGDASKIWRNRSSKYVKTTFQRIYGVGAGISSMVVLLLERCFGIWFNDIDHRDMDVKPDTHVIRVFDRLGLISRPNEEEALKAARRLNPEYPGALDAPIWVIGRRWCSAYAPQCLHCPVYEVCPKNIISNKLKQRGGED